MSIKSDEAHPRKPERSLAFDDHTSFPTYQDLAEFLVADQEIASVSDLEGKRSDLLADLFLHWLRQGQHACHFAKRIAKRLEQPVWWPFVWPNAGPGLPTTLAPILRFPHERSEAILLILPGISTPEGVVNLINWLCAHPDWYWTEESWSDYPPDPDRFLVGLRWKLPDREHVSWVLGFAPFEGMPFTRRVHGAPFSVLGIRHRFPPSNQHPVFGDDKSPNVHLANMPLELTDDKVEPVARRTRDRKRQLLDGENMGAARAKITFALPMTVRDQITDPALDT